MKNNMLENFRRLWPIALVWALFELLAEPVRLLIMGHGDILRERMFSLYTLGNGSAFAMAINVAFTLIIGVAVFRYAHSHPAITVMHSLPIRRGRLFLSNWLSGLIILALPQVITTLCLLPFAKLSFAHLFTPRAELAKIDPRYDEYGNIMNDAYHTDAGDLLRYLVITLIALFFIYAITVFAGVITGTTPLHIIVAAILNVVAPITYFVVMGLLTIFLYGFPTVYFYGLLLEIRWLHPLLAFFDMPPEPGMPGDVLPALLFVIVGMIFSAAAFALYKKLKSERVGRPFTFNVAEYAFVILITLFGMTICALLFSEARGYSGGLAEELRAQRLFFYGGALIGSVVTYLIATMIARKTARIFDLRLLKNFGIYAVCAVVFLVCTTTDITGYEKRVPAVSAVSSAEISLSSYNIMPYRWDQVMDKVIISDAAGREYVAALHELIVTSDKKYANSLDDYENVLYIEDGNIIDEELTFDESYLEMFDHGGSLNINYMKRGGGNMARYYSLAKEITETAQFKSLVGSQAWLEASTIDKRYTYKNLKEVYVSAYDSYQYTLSNGDSAFEKKLTETEIRELAGHLDADYVKLSADDLISRSIDDELLTFSFEMKSRDDGFDTSFIYSVTDDYTGTIAWLKEKGYYEDMLRATQQLKAEAEADYEKNALSK